MVWGHSLRALNKGSEGPQKDFPIRGDSGWRGVFDASLEGGIENELSRQYWRQGGW